MWNRRASAVHVNLKGQQFTADDSRSPFGSELRSLLVEAFYARRLRILSSEIPIAKPKDTYDRQEDQR